MRLSEIKTVCDVLLIKIDNEDYSVRLESFGFTPGHIFSVISVSRGMYLVKISNSVYAMNAVLADAFVVSEVDK